MIAVVFEPRFGSSKVMQALADSGYPVLGEKFPAWIKEEDRQWNPLGFYEHGDVRKAIAECNGPAAIKLRVKEAMEIPLPPDTRFIYCVRDVFFAAQSQMRSGLMPWTNIEEGIKHNTIALEEMDELGVITPHMERHGMDDIPDCFWVDHEAWIANPEAEKDRLLRWVHGV